MADLVFIADDNNRGATLVNSINDHTPAAAPEYVRGDHNSTRIFLGVKGQPGVYHANSGLAGVGVKLAIVKPGEQVTGGTFKLSHGGNDTDELAYNLSASALETALDGLSGVAVSVEGEFPCYQVTWDATDAQTDFTADDVALTPDGLVNISVITEGDGSTQEVVMIEVVRSPKAQQGTWATITDPANGWEADFPMTDRKLCAALGTNAITDLTLELEIIDTAGKTNTPAQVPCKVRQQGIHNTLPGTEDQTQFDDRTTSDARYLLEANNLSDLADAATARTNIGMTGANTTYSPATPGNWTGPPADVKAALDELGARNPASNDETEINNTTGSPTLNPSAAGSSNITPTDSKAISTFEIVPGAGSGAYEYEYIIQRPSSGEPAPLLVFDVTPVASNNPTIIFKDEGPTGSAGDDIELARVTFTKYVQSHDEPRFLLFQWNGSAWKLRFDNGGDARGYVPHFFPARTMISRDTDGAAVASEETTTNKRMWKTWSFEASLDKYVQFDSDSNGGWDLTNATSAELLVQFVWRCTATGGTGDVVWGIQSAVIGNNVDCDTAWGTLATVTDTQLNLNRVHRSPWVTMTPSNVVTGSSPFGEGEYLSFQALMNGTNGAHSHNKANELIGIRILSKVLDPNEEENAKTDP